jgi:hypothetical protein
LVTRTVVERTESTVVRPRTRNRTSSKPTTTFLNPAPAVARAVVAPHVRPGISTRVDGNVGTVHFGPLVVCVSPVDVDVVVDGDADGDVNDSFGGVTPSNSVAVAVAVHVDDHVNVNLNLHPNDSTFSTRDSSTPRRSTPVGSSDCRLRSRSR